jgi:CheY-like chemotaxis protein
MTPREREGDAPEPGQSGVAAAEESAAASARPASHHDEPSGRRPILAVDDDAGVLALVVRALRGRGYSVRGFPGGREALLAIYGPGSTPSLLLTDIDMPGMSGIELAARVAADRPGVPIVLMSGSSSLIDMARDRPELVRGVLRKPFGVHDLIAVVEDTIGPPPPAEDPSGA